MMTPKQPLTSASAGSLRVVGSSYLAETRTICNILEHSKIPFKFEETDIFTAEGQKATGGLGLVIIDEKGNTVLADSASLFRYIAAKLKLQMKPFEESMIEYVQTQVKRNSDRLAKLVLERVRLDKE